MEPTATAEVSAAAAYPEPTPVPEETETSGDERTYTVQHGDTLTQIAAASAHRRTHLPALTGSRTLRRSTWGRCCGSRNPTGHVGCRKADRGESVRAASMGLPGRSAHLLICGVDRCCLPARQPASSGSRARFRTPMGRRGTSGCRGGWASIGRDPPKMASMRCRFCRTVRRFEKAISAHRSPMGVSFWAPRSQLLYDWAEIGTPVSIRYATWAITFNERTRIGYG